MDLIATALIAVLSAMVAIFGVVAAILISAAGRLTSDEFKSFRPTIVDWLISRAVKKMPVDMQARYAEEWRSCVEDIPGDISKVVASIGYNIVPIRLRYTDLTLDLCIKRALDSSIALFMLIFIGPLLAVVAVSIWYQDGGSPFFRHTRIGRNGKYFGCLKFRTMYLNSEEILAKHLASSPEAQIEWAKSHKLENDPRVTYLGSMLRKSSLDELPQIINVLQGDMSFIGPRPIVDAEKNRYGDRFKSCFSVRPGITGLWQVSGRSETTYEERVRMDHEYSKTRSLWLDLKIFIKTVPAVFLDRDDKKKKR